MEQRQLPQPESTQIRRRPGGPGDAGDSSAETTEGNVRIIWGATIDDLELGGMTVAEATQLLTGPYNIAPGVRINVNGHEAEADDRLIEGDELEFVRAAGQKGGAA